MPQNPRIRPKSLIVCAATLSASLALTGHEASAQERPAAAVTSAHRPQVITGPWYWRNAKGDVQGGMVDRLDTEGITWRETDSAKPARIRWTEVEELRRNLESSIDASQDTTPGPMILLPDRDKLRGEAAAILTQGLAVQSSSIGVVNVPLAQWAGFLSQSPETPVAFLRTIEQLRRGSDSPGDLVLLANGDRMQGTVIELDADNLKVQPTGAAKPITLPRKGIQGVAIDASTLEYPAIEGIGWKVQLTDGSRLSAKALSFDPSDPESGLILTTRWGSEWRVPVNKLTGLRVIQPGMIELDTVKPAAIQTVEYIGPTTAPRFGANVCGGPLKIGTRTFDQGIGTQSRTLIAYRLDGTKKTFTAWVGLENSAGPKGQARAVVLLDGKPAYDSGPLKAGEMPRRVQIDLGTARLLILASEFGEGGGVRDWVNWCEPLIRP